MPAVPASQPFTIEQIIAPKGPAAGQPAAAVQTQPFTIAQIVAPKGPAAQPAAGLSQTLVQKDEALPDPSIAILAQEQQAPPQPGAGA